MKVDYWEMVKIMWVFIWKFWQIWLFIIAIFVIKIIIEIVLPNEFKRLKNAIKFKKGEEWRLDQDLLRWLRGMKPAEFEDYIADLFSQLGFKTEAVGRSYDGGIDVIAEKDGVKHYIQCKKFITSRVNVHDVRDFYGALANKLAKGKGYFITTNKFTLEAEKFVEDKPIELIDGHKLIEYIRLADNKKDVCPKCDGYLIKRKGKFGEFYGCSNYPKCRFARQLK